MSRALITGITGFTGQYVAALLRARGDEVYGIVHHDRERGNTDANGLYVCDIADEVTLAAIVARVRPNQVIHLAAISFVAHGDVEEMYRTNVLGTRALLRSCAAVKEPPSRVLVASSANVYGNARGGILDEGTPIRPANDYGVTKAAVEHIAAIYAAVLPVIVVRPFNYTGVGQSLSFLIPKIVDHVRRRADCIQLGNLDVARDFSDVRAIARAYVRLLHTEGAVGGTFNVCSGHAVTLRQILHLAMTITGHHIDVAINPAFVRSDEVKTLAGTAARIEEVIGPLHMPAIEETLRWMIEV